MAETSYVVLLLEGDAWAEVGEYTGHNDQVAIRKASEGYLTTEQVTLVAVPTRSWTPQTLTVTTKRVVTLTPAAAAASPPPQRTREDE